jgi:uncharacterized protein
VSDASAPPQAVAKKRWQPLSAIDRRVIGVLAEKAKTTPDGYPMSLNAICTGCNQKSNRSPLMQLEPADVEESLDRLREMGAVGIIEGYGRVAKYRHYLYEWFTIPQSAGAELSVMTELMLRGDQTIGELRGRASRMDPIPDLAALKSIIDSLKGKGLVLSLTPEGRGQVVSHALYKPREIDALKAKYAGAAAAPVAYQDEDVAIPSPAAPARHAPANVSVMIGGDQVSTLKNDLQSLRGELAQLRQEVETLAAENQRTNEELRRLKEDLGAG